jgi:hypothetical protein
VAELPDIERIQISAPTLSFPTIGEEAEGWCVSAPVPAFAGISSMALCILKHEGVGGDSPWLADTDHLDTGELTIQEALRNAEDALQRDLEFCTKESSA